MPWLWHQCHQRYNNIARLGVMIISLSLLGSPFPVCPLLIILPLQSPDILNTDLIAIQSHPQSRTHFPLTHFPLTHFPLTHFPLTHFPLNLTLSPLILSPSRACIRLLPSPPPPLPPPISSTTHHPWGGISLVWADYLLLMQSLQVTPLDTALPSSTPTAICLSDPLIFPFLTHCQFPTNYPTVYYPPTGPSYVYRPPSARAKALTPTNNYLPTPPGTQTSLLFRRF